MWEAEQITGNPRGKFGVYCFCGMWEAEQITGNPRNSLYIRRD